MPASHSSIFTLTVTSLLFGCASGPTNSSSPTSSGPSIEAPTQLRVGFNPTCPSKESKKESAVLATVGATIAASIGQKVTEATLDKISSYLSRNEEYTLDGDGRMEAFAIWTKEGDIKPNPEQQCMIVVIGKSFAPANLSKKAFNELTKDFKNPFPNYDNAVVYKTTGLIGEPLLYLEALIEFRDSKNSPSFFHFTPRAWYYPKFISDDSWRFNKARDFLLKVDLTIPGQPKPFATLEIKQEDMVPGGLTSNSVIDKIQPWVPLPDVIDKPASPEKIKTDEYVYPVNARALITETKKPHTLLKYLGEAASSQKDEISRFVGDEIMKATDQSARLAAKETALSTASTKYDAYVTSYTAASDAVAAYQAASENAKAQARTKAEIAIKKLAIARAVAKSAIKEAGIGGFEDLPPLASLGN
ncbi:MULTISPECIES: hypothetical protein [Pseudomonas]|uniref:hypothetical protein n=1 Tax=Pseudomonas TaxID=286 RepID=UPI001269BA83|nr:hypothetical protein [Pseudomonas sp. PI1]